MRVFGLLRVDDIKKAKLLPTLNEINVKYRFIKVTCDKDGDVNVEYDFPVRGSNPGASAGEIGARFVKIINEIYPLLMRSMWG